MSNETVPHAPGEHPFRLEERLPNPRKETFVGQPITPADVSFAASPMALGEPGLPRKFSWQGRAFSVTEILEQWKETGDCRHGSGERYVRKHWYRIRTTEDLEMTIYFERQARSRGKPRGASRWRLYTLRTTEPGGRETRDDSLSK